MTAIKKSNLAPVTSIALRRDGLHVSQPAPLTPAEDAALDELVRLLARLHVRNQLKLRR